ncbi:MAG: serine/threonine protein phosphatase [Methanobacteriota archaeon]|nr:MAG: serine/threonine protein phosphatase [Euryarchaeota archaeon]
MPISADNVRSLHAYDIRVLRSLEYLMRRYQWVPEDVLRANTKFSESELAYRLQRLINRGMIRSGDVSYGGYTLVFGGYDALALHTLTERGSVRALGSLIGVGKESEVYEGLGLSPLVLKFHRIGQRSFLAARVDRGYMPDEGHVPWIFASARSAEREFDALRRLHHKVRVPHPLDRSRHVVVMAELLGPNLNKCVLDDPRAAYDDILLQVREAYACGVVHADLSEFNVIVWDNRCWLIDWPQWIPTDHPNALDYLRRDVKNVVEYFKRKYHLECPLEDAVARVVG